MNRQYGGAIFTTALIILAKIVVIAVKAARAARAAAAAYRTAKAIKMAVKLAKVAKKVYKVGKTVQKGKNVKKVLKAVKAVARDVAIEEVVTLAGKQAVKLINNAKTGGVAKVLANSRATTMNMRKVVGTAPPSVARRSLLSSTKPMSYSYGEQRPILSRNAQVNKMMSGASSLRTKSQAFRPDI